MRAGEIGRALLLASVLAGLLLPWLTVAPNRLLPGTGMPGFSALGWAGPAALLALALAVPWRLPAWLGAGAGLAGLALLLAATGWAAAAALEGMAPAARAGLGGGFWLGLMAGAALVVARAAALPTLGRVALAALALLVLAGLWQAETFAALSLVVEYQARQAAVHAALLRHLALAGAALALALLLAVPLAWAGFRRPRAAGPMGAALGAVQVVPAIALFAALIPLLAGLLALLPALRGLGLGAIGPAPAVLATAGYLALPLWRSILGGLTAADPAAVAAARAMGMTEGGITREVRLPLALPVFAGGLRLAVVQAIGLVTLGGLVGAGGLGALVFEGLAQFATDLMLLGALPIMALALAADALARLVEQRLGTNT
ncbi:ABC transporter permease subunit [Falsiroseomonas tokyonensis]|uniref:ABC transporter permease subunit n=1 Tax=Falsiroseomonas tokyonensis TaxID=430521 RepID=A0ABV7BM61_9PROT|nr:ABC transporter permease subunit [Falsiroseomonas tokyonensis]MBU8536664.1 ABC transporter permease subunit [Falsiroseomonas tokyonensis]